MWDVGTTHVLMDAQADMIKIGRKIVKNSRFNCDSGRFNIAF